MFKTDKESIEKLSFTFDEHDISRLKTLLDLIKHESLSTLPESEIERLTKGLDEIGKLKLNSKFYAFHISDSYCEEDRDEGVKVYQRHGDKLEEYIVLSHRDYLLDADEVADRLIKRKIKEIYTGQIPYASSFLGLSQQSDSKHPIIKSILNDDEIEVMRSKGIVVNVLDSLI